jgi:hypothetical protein
MLFSLSVNVAVVGPVDRAQPSGTFTVYVFAGVVYATYCWLSGMSPLALTSGRFGFAGEAPVQVLGPDVDGVAAPRPAAGWDAGDPPPHAAVASASAAVPLRAAALSSAVAPRVRFMVLLRRRVDSVAVST